MKHLRRLWESVGLVTDNKGGWNNGGLGGFHHWVYSTPLALLALHLVDVYYKEYVPLVSSIVIALLFFTLEVSQAKAMRHKQVYCYWRFWQWHIGRHQDYLVPAILNYFTQLMAYNYGYA